MQGPSPVSALLRSAAMVVAGAYLLLRTGTLLEASGWGSEAVAWAGAATAVGLGMVAVAQTDLKQLLAASTSAQIGFMVLAAGVGATVGGTLQLMAHASAKSLLFLVAGVWLTALGTQQLPALRGAARYHRTVGVICTVGAISLAGLPPLSLWAAKDVVLAGALARDPWLYAAGLAAAVLSAVYSAKVLWFVWPPAARRDDGRTIPGGVVPPLTVLAVACVALTPVVFPPLRDALGRVLGTTAQPEPYAWELTVSGALAVVAAAAAWAWGSRPLPLPGQAQAQAKAQAKAACRDWLGLERAAHALVVSPVLWTARTAAAFDDRILDVESTARPTARYAWPAGRTASWSGQSTEASARSPRRLGRWAAGPAGHRPDSCISTSLRPSRPSPSSLPCSSS